MRSLAGVALFFAASLCAQEGDGKIWDEDEQGEVLGALTVTEIDSGDTIWRTGTVFGLNFNQVSLTNWAGGGQSSVAATGLTSLFANYAIGKIGWDNTLDISYGLITKAQSGWQKSDDRFELSSKLGIKAGTKGMFYTAFFNLKSQFSPGYKYPNDTTKISDFFAPGYLLAGLGIDYKPSADFTIMLAPLTGKLTFVMNQDLADAGAFGVDEAEYDATGLIKIKDGANMRQEFGGYFKLMYKVDLFDNVSFMTKVDLFSNYLNNPQNIDVNWETLLSMEVNKFISATISTMLIYDDDVDISVDHNHDGNIDELGPRVQFKQAFAVGFSYTL